MISVIWNIGNQLCCYGNHPGCYGLGKTLEPVTSKIYDSFLSKNVHRTEIDKVEPKLWRFTLGTLILGHPVGSSMCKHVCGLIIVAKHFCEWYSWLRQFFHVYQAVWYKLSCKWSSNCYLYTIQQLQSINYNITSLRNFVFAFCLDSRRT